MSKSNHDSSHMRRPSPKYQGETCDDSNSMVPVSKECRPVCRKEVLPESYLLRASLDSESGQSIACNLMNELSLIEPVFCLPDRISGCLAYLNQEFASLGLPPVRQENALQNDTLASLLNNIYRVLCRQRLCNKMMEEQQLRQIQSDGELSRLRQVSVKLSTQLEEKERELSQFHCLNTQLEEKSKQLAAALKTEKDEVRRLQSTVQYKQVQYKHESKKKELELNRLKDRLHQVIADRTEKHGVVISAKTPAAAKFRNEHSITGSFGTNEATQLKLLSENVEFRKVLCNLQKELIEVLDVKISDEETVVKGHEGHEDIFSSNQMTIDLDSCSEAQINSNNSNITVPFQIPIAYFEMPVELVKEDILTSFQNKFQLLKKKLENSEKLVASLKLINLNEFTKSSEVVERSQLESNEIARLANELNQCRSIIEQQSAFIMSQFEQVTGEVPFLKDTDYLEEEQYSNTEKQTEDAKRKMNEVTERLYDEVYIQHQAKYHILREHFMQITPLKLSNSQLYTNSLKKSISSNLHKKSALDLYLCTPSHLTGKLFGIPATVDLYRKLGLTDESGHSGEFEETMNDDKENNKHVRLLTTMDSSTTLVASDQESVSTVDSIKVHLFGEQLEVSGVENLVHQTSHQDHSITSHSNLSQEQSRTYEDPDEYFKNTYLTKSKEE